LRRTVEEREKAVSQMRLIHNPLEGNESGGKLVPSQSDSSALWKLGLEKAVSFRKEQNKPLLGTKPRGLSDFAGSKGDHGSSHWNLVATRLRSSRFEHANMRGGEREREREREREEDNDNATQSSSHTRSEHHLSPKSASQMAQGIFGAAVARLTHLASEKGSSGSGPPLSGSRRNPPSDSPNTVESQAAEDVLLDAAEQLMDLKQQVEGAPILDAASMQQRAESAAVFEKALDKLGSLGELRATMENLVAGSRDPVDSTQHEALLSRLEAAETERDDELVRIRGTIYELKGEVQKERETVEECQDEIHILCEEIEALKAERDSGLQERQRLLEELERSAEVSESLRNAADFIADKWSGIACLQQAFFTWKLATVQQVMAERDAVEQERLTTLQRLKEEMTLVNRHAIEESKVAELSASSDTAAEAEAEETLPVHASLHVPHAVSSGGERERERERGGIRVEAKLKKISSKRRKSHSRKSTARKEKELTTEAAVIPPSDLAALPPVISPPLTTLEAAGEARRERQAAMEASEWSLLVKKYQGEQYQVPSAEKQALADIVARYTVDVPEAVPPVQAAGAWMASSSVYGEKGNGKDDDTDTEQEGGGNKENHPQPLPTPAAAPSTLRSVDPAPLRYLSPDLTPSVSLVSPHAHAQAQAQAQSQGKGKAHLPYQPHIPRRSDYEASSFVPYAGPGTYQRQFGMASSQRGTSQMEWSHTAYRSHRHHANVLMATKSGGSTPLAQQYPTLSRLLSQPEM
jgi:hypothetical protein